MNKHLKSLGFAFIGAGCYAIYNEYRNRKRDIPVTKADDVDISYNIGQPNSFGVSLTEKDDDGNVVRVSYAILDDEKVKSIQRDIVRYFYVGKESINGS